MNCPKCGSLLPQGAQFCNVCNEPIGSSAYSYGQAQQGIPPGYTAPPGYQQPTMPGYTAPQQGYGTQGYPQQPMPGYDQPAQGYPDAYPPTYQQSYAQYNPQNSYPQGYQQPYGGYYGSQPQRREPGGFLTALQALPRLVPEVFRDPGGVLGGLMERRDIYTGPMVAGLSLVTTFLCAMMATRGMVAVVFGLIESITGMSLASDAAGLNQGISLVAGRISAGVGGIAVLCQLLAILLPAAVLMVYLCAVCKVRFSWELLCGSTGVTTLPTVLASLGATLASLLSPWIGLLLCLLGMVASYVLMGALMERMTGKTGPVMVLPKIICCCASLVLTLLLVLLLGGAMMNGIFRSMIMQLGI